MFWYSRLGVGRHYSKPMVVGHQGSHIGRESQFRCVLLVFGKGRLDLGFFGIQLDRRARSTHIVAASVLTAVFSLDRKGLLAQSGHGWVKGRKEGVRRTNYE